MHSLRSVARIAAIAAVTLAIAGIGTASVATAPAWACDVQVMSPDGEPEGCNDGEGDSGGGVHVFSDAEGEVFTAPPPSPPGPSVEWIHFSDPDGEVIYAPSPSGGMDPPPDVDTTRIKDCLAEAEEWKDGLFGCQTRQIVFCGTAAQAQKWVKIPCDAAYKWICKTEAKKVYEECLARTGGPRAGHEPIPTAEPPP